MVDESTARQLAEDMLAHWPNYDDPDREVVIWKMEEHSRGWVFHYATRRWLRTRDFTDLLVGGCPIIVDRNSGELHV